MKVKYKLFGLCLIGVLGILLTLAYSFKISNDVDHLAQSRIDLGRLEIELLTMRKHEKDFISRLDSKYLDGFSNNADKFMQISKTMSDELAYLDIELTGKDQIRQDLQSYLETFKSLVKAYQALGLSNQQGLLSSYQQEREAMVSQALREHDTALLEGILVIDRNMEKGDSVAENEFPQQMSQLVATAQSVVEQMQIVGVRYDQGLKGETRLASYNVEEEFAHLSKELDQKVSQHIEYLTLQKLLVSIGLVIFLIISSVTIALIIVRRITQQVDLMENIAKTNNLALRADSKGNDELSQMSRSFNQLLEKIYLLVTQSQQKSSQLAGSALEMKQQLESVLHDFDGQSQQTGLMATAVHQMSSMISEIAANTEDAATKAQLSHQNAISGQTAVREAANEIDQLSTTLTQSQVEIGQLNELVVQIGSVVEMIQGVAEQTNLLALNAAIEAARAGEQGRGFAVVADEVRSLATRTQSSTEEISAIIGSIQTQTTKVVTNIERCSGQGNVSVNKSNSALAILDNIIQDVSLISDTSIQIAAAIEEQSVATNEVSSSIEQVNEVTMRNVESATLCLSEVESIAQQAEEMKEQVALFKV